jgi:hypothetical protein
MAEDSKLGFSNLTPANKSPRGNATSDPLAELARLIGQDQVFDQMRRDAVRANQNPPPAAPANPAPHSRATPQAPWLDATRAAREAMRNPPAAAAAAPRPAAPAHEPPAARRTPVVHDAPAVHSEPYYEDASADPHGAAHATYADEPYGEDDYVEPKRRRGWAMPVAAALGVVAIGAAGVYGYRAISGGGSAAQPPVIAADKSPAKIVPPTNTAANDPISGKIGFERNERGLPERVVPREEQPLDPTRAAARPSINTGNTGTAGTTGGIGQMPPVAAAGNPNEPKKVRTMTIRPDGSVAAESLAAKPPGATRGVAPNAPAAAPPSNTRMPSARPGSPQSNAGDAVRPPSEVPMQTASITPMVPTRTTANPSAAGSHVVQISSQKTEADAQSSFRSLQAKYPSVLGKREPLIRKVELGSRGTFYRAQVGPFASIEQANELCNDLKAAGGQCMVQRN